VSKYEHHQSHFNLRKFLLGFFISQKQWDPNFLLLCISFFLCIDLQSYSHDRFSKILRTFFVSRNYWIIVVFLQRTLKEKLPFVLINTLLLRIPLLALADERNYGQRSKYTCCAWAGGTFFQLCCCVIFLFWRDIGFGFTYLFMLLKNIFYELIFLSQITVCRVEIWTPPITL
jgi:hypothetical protein